MTHPLTATMLIDALGLRPLRPEGGHFRRTYVADESLARDALPARYGRDKPCATAIYYLLTGDADSFSALHRLPTDEVYHFYLGDPVALLALHPDGRGEEIVLGPDVLAGQRVQHVVKRGVWQGSRLVAGGRFALLGTTMAPGFDDGDFEPGDSRALAAAYPEHAAAIGRLTRRATARGDR